MIYISVLLISSLLFVCWDEASKMQWLEVEDGHGEIKLMSDEVGL